jgi:hypothetical protein
MAVFLTDSPSLSLLTLILSYNAARRALVGVSGAALDTDDAAFVGVVGTDEVLGMRFVGVEVGVTRPSEEGVYAAASFAAALPNDGVRIPRLRLPLLGVTTPSLEPEGDSPGRGPCGVTGPPGMTGNGILNPSESFESGERPCFEGVEVTGRDLRGVGR